MKFLIDVYIVGKSSKLEENGSEGHRKLISIVNSAARCSLASHTLYLLRNHHATVKLLPCILIVSLVIYDVKVYCIELITSY